MTRKKATKNDDTTPPSDEQDVLTTLEMVEPVPSPDTVVGDSITVLSPVSPDPVKKPKLEVESEEDKEPEPEKEEDKDS